MDLLAHVTAVVSSWFAAGPFAPGGEEFATCGESRCVRRALLMRRAWSVSAGLVVGALRSQMRTCARGWGNGCCGGPSWFWGGALRGGSFTRGGLYLGRTAVPTLEFRNISKNMQIG